MQKNPDEHRALTAVLPSWKGIIIVLSLLVIIMLMVLQGLRLVIPDPVSASEASETGFIRVQQDLQTIAASPHPTGSPRQEYLRNWLKQAMRDTGFSVTEQKFDTITTAGPVQGVNLIATRESVSDRPTLLVVAHYDSAEKAPGAGDDGMAVASVLQMMRDTASLPASGLSITVLITDDEERGLTGARYFLSRMTDEEKSNVAAVLNFEARGNRGMPLLFETSDRNAGLVSALAGGVKTTVGFSFSSFIYRFLPNDTDFTVFRNAGMDGLNFAVIGGEDYYHSFLDNVSNLSPATVWQYQRLVRETGMFFLSQPKNQWTSRQNAAWFPLPGGMVVIPDLFVWLAGFVGLILCSIQAVKILRTPPPSLPRKNALLYILAGIMLTFLAFLAPAAAYLLLIPVLFLLTATVLFSRWTLIFSGIILCGLYLSGLLFIPVIYLLAFSLNLTQIASLLALIPIGVWLWGIVLLARQSVSSPPH